MLYVVTLSQYLAPSSHPTATHIGVFVPVLKDSTSVHEIEYGLHGSYMYTVGPLQTMHACVYTVPSEVLKSIPPVYLSCVFTYMYM